MLGIEDFGDYGITVSVLFRTIPTEQLAVLREARLRIKKAFDRERIDLPPPREVIHHVHPPEGKGPVVARDGTPERSAEGSKPPAA